LLYRLSYASAAVARGAASAFLIISKPPPLGQFKAAAWAAGAALAAFAALVRHEFLPTAKAPIARTPMREIMRR
jgi:hypothetical protein